MRILILSNFGMGLYKFRKELISKLLSKDMEVLVSFPQDEYTQKIEELGCSFIDTPLDRRGMNPIKDIRLLRHYRSIIKENKPNVVLTYTIKPNVYGGLACQLEKTPYITNITGLGTSLESKGLLSSLVSKIYKIGIRKSNHVFFQNHNNLDYFKNRNILKSYYSILPGSGVNLNEFKYHELPKKKKISLLYIGRIMKSKGIDEFLEAANHLSKRYDYLEFNIVGFNEEEYEEVLMDNVTRGTIKYHGSQSDVKPFIKDCTAIIQPSYHEGLSNVLLEGAAMGRPLIASDIPGCKEVIDDKINGYLFEPRNSDSLIASIEQFINLKKDEVTIMGKNSRVKVEKEFDRNIVVNEYLKNIGEILEGQDFNEGFSN